MLEVFFLDYRGFCLFERTNLRDLKLPRTQTSLRTRKGRREGDNGRLSSVPFQRSLAVHHQSLAFRARLCHAKNEAPEEDAGFEGSRVDLYYPTDPVMTISPFHAL